MYTYRIIYGGQDIIKAESRGEAYRKFREEIRKRCDGELIGLIVESSDPAFDQEEGL